MGHTYLKFFLQIIIIQSLNKQINLINYIRTLNAQK